MQNVRKYLLDRVAKKELSNEDAKEMLIELEKDKGIIKEDIAIIGISAKLPQANTVEQFWDNIKNGKNCSSEFPQERKDDINYINANPSYSELLTGKYSLDNTHESDFAVSNYLDEIDKFDANFFGISPKEALYMDPNQRMALRLAWHAIEDAGYGNNKIYGTKTGVFIGKEGTNSSNYRYYVKKDPMQVTGSWESIIASRISYLYNFRAPCMIVDTACSSGLVCLHLAIQSIKRKESEMALVGGIQLVFGEYKKNKGIIDLSSIESPDKTVRTFDKNANGTTWGEGVVFYLLKPYKKALDDHDNIYAIIRGSAINNDGLRNGLTAPNAEAQEEVILRAWEDAGINPEDIGYYESHGTGTILGDPIEIKGVTNAFKKYTNKKQFCAIGSLKTNIGHIVAASGLAGLLKVILTIKNKEIIPNKNFNEPNPLINFIDSPVYVSDIIKKWDSDKSRLGCVSSFGFSGTNCHVVLEEFKGYDNQIENNKNKYYCFTISAKKESVLRDYIKNYELFLENYNRNFDDLCYTTNTGRGHYNHRLVILVKNKEELLKKIKNISCLSLTEINEENVFYNFHKIVSETKKNLQKGEITGKDKKDKNELIKFKLEKYFIDTNNTTILSDVCKHYVDGGDVDWEIFYQGKKYNKVNAPVYPYENTRIWAEHKISKIKLGQSNETVYHPLVEVCLSESLDEMVFETQFEIKKHWELNDHRIAGTSILVGTSYVEILRAAARKIYKDGFLEIKDLFLFNPLIVQEDEIKKIIIIVKKFPDHLKIKVAEKNIENDEVKWTQFSEGKVYRYNGDIPPPIDLEKIKKRLPKNIGEYRVLEEGKTVFYFGKRWYNFRDVYLKDYEILVSICLDEEFQKDMEFYELHPSMLDQAANLMMRKFSGVNLPFTFKSVKLFNRMPKLIYSHIRAKVDEEKNKEIIPFDVTITDEFGNIIAEINDYTIKKARKMEIELRDKAAAVSEYYKIEWKEIQAEKNISKFEGVYLYFKDIYNISNKFISKLKDCGASVVEIEFGNEYKKVKKDHFIISDNEEDYSKLLKDFGDISIKRIIHGGNITGENEIDSIDILREKENHGVYSLFYLVKSLVNNKIKIKDDIILLADYANDIIKNEKKINPHSASLFGLGKVVWQEYSNIKCRSIDFDDDTSIDLIINEIESNSKYFHVAYRNNKKYIPQLETFTVSMDTFKELKTNGDGVYIITGGTGGLGLEMAKFLASKGKDIQLALINRSKFPDKNEWDKIISENKNEKIIKKIKDLREIEAFEGKVFCYSANISDYKEMNNLIKKIRTKFGKINGIIHAAGVAGDGFIMKKSKEVFKEVLIPKIEGTWILDNLTKNDNLDFFVMFSSIAALMGSQGQGDYTAANCYMDSYASQRKINGKNGIAINWPSWSETGMAVDYNLSDDYILFKSISTFFALNAFEIIISSNQSKIIPSVLNYNFLINNLNTLTFDLSNDINTTLEKIKRKKSFENKKASNEKREDVIIKGKSNDELSDNEKVLSNIYANILGIGEIDIYDGFQEMGGDSMLAMSLLQAIESQYPGIVEISDIFSNPSVELMSKYISSKINGDKKENNKVVNEDENLKNILDNIDENSSIDNLVDKLVNI